jgi:head-to-tail connecting protein
MPDDPKAVELIRERDRLKGDRQTYESAWRDIRRLVRPNTTDFQAQTSSGDVRTEWMYDGTAMQSNTDLANAVHSFLINPSERNFGIKAAAVNRELNNDPDAREWMDQVSEIIASEYADDRSMFTSALQEAFLDLAFGNLIINQEWDSDNGHLIFRACPLANCYFDENKNGVIDCVYRCLEMEVRQIEQQFPLAAWEDKDRDKQEKKYHVLHVVEPRDNRTYGREDKTNMPYKSCWVLEEKKYLLEEGGYLSLPYHIGRWSKSDEELYGRGPAINCLPDIRMLNRMEFTIIKAAQKAVDPPLIMPADGFLDNFKTSPGSINFRDPSMGEFEVQTLEHKGNFPIGEEKSEQKREFIRRCFYADWVKLMPKKERQTAYEISELVEQQLRMMAPMLGRLQSEEIVPMVQRSYLLLLRAGRFPDAPESMRGARIEVDYVSAASRAQAATRLVSYNRLVQNLAIFQPFAPDVVDAIDPDVIAQDMAILSGVPAKAVRSPDDIASIRNARAQQQQLQAAVDAVPQIAGAAKDFSQANQAGGIL